MKFNSIKMLYINCTLNKSPKKSHTSTLMKVSQKIPDKENVSYEEIRFIDYDIAPGIYPDMSKVF